MQKIPTIFNRDWEGNCSVVPDYAKGYALPGVLGNAQATEKLDGMNVRVTVRSGVAVRLEKRRNPSKVQHKLGIDEPWYVDADRYDPQDKHIWTAFDNTNCQTIKNGEWSGEAIGPGIQGDYYKLDKPMIYFFSLLAVPFFEGVPVDYDGLRVWLPQQHSFLNQAVPIEGIVWHTGDGLMFKIKTKDFK